MRRHWLLLILAIMIALAGCGGETWEPDDDGGVTNVTLTEPEETSMGTDTESETEGAPADTATAAPTDTLTPTDTPTPTAGESYEFGSIGSDTTDPFSVRGGLVVVELDSKLGGEFAAWIVDDDGGERQLVETDERWDGRVALMLPEGQYRLRIETNMPWEATVRQPSFPRSEARSPPVRVGGEDSNYVPVALDGATTVELRGEEDTEYAVRLVTPDGRSVPLASGSGPDTWEETVDGEGPVLVQVETDGEWELRIEE